MRTNMISKEVRDRENFELNILFFLFYTIICVDYYFFIFYISLRNSPIYHLYILLGFVCLFVCFKYYKKAPDFITRLGSTVSSNDFGHQHPYKEGSHTERLRNASVQKGCGKKCTWQRTASSHNSPLSFDDSSTSKSNSKSVYGQPYAGSGRNGGLSNPNNNQNKNRNKSGNNNDNRPETAPPFAVSVLQHPNDFNKSSTKHQLGKQVTNRFYNTTGGWSASRA
mmetsp:Transcript_4003/g.5276  ORF Transcript_4003/g.5276 Transcript_4003/m.5276 type:complete len:224 (+) Transcript_4003:678-1349(+)